MTANQNKIIKASLNFAQSALYAYIHAESVEERDFYFNDIRHAEEIIAHTLESLALEEPRA